MRIQPIEDPYDAHERELMRAIEKIHRRAREEAQPLVNALLASRLTKPPRYLVTSYTLGSDKAPDSASHRGL